MVWEWADFRANIQISDVYCSMKKVKISEKVKLFECFGHFQEMHKENKNNLFYLLFKK